MGGREGFFLNITIDMQLYAHTTHQLTPLFTITQLIHKECTITITPSGISGIYDVSTIGSAIGPRRFESGSL
jgi:hypothetical protein